MIDHKKFNIALLRIFFIIMIFLSCFLFYLLILENLVTENRQSVYKSFHFQCFYGFSFVSILLKVFLFFLACGQIFIFGSLSRFQATQSAIFFINPPINWTYHTYQLVYTSFLLSVNYSFICASYESLFHYDTLQRCSSITHCWIYTKETWIYANIETKSFLSNCLIALLFQRKLFQFNSFLPQMYYKYINIISNIKDINIIVG